MGSASEEIMGNQLLSLFDAQQESMAFFSLPQSSSSFFPLLPPPSAASSQQFEAEAEEPGLLFSLNPRQDNHHHHHLHYLASAFATEPAASTHRSSPSSLWDVAGERLMSSRKLINGGGDGGGCSDKAQVRVMKMKRIKGRKKVREPRFCFKTMSDVDVLDDGYKWRKYGQKVVKNTLHPRSYYRCTEDKCRVKKRVERLAEDPRMVITTYEGRHAHSPSRDNLEETMGQLPTGHLISNFFW